jgi:hypothetical protein
MITGDSFSVTADLITELWLELSDNLHVWEDENYAQNYKNYFYKLKFNKKEDDICPFLSVSVVVWIPELRPAVVGVRQKLAQQFS